MPANRSGARHSGRSGLRCPSGDWNQEGDECNSGRERSSYFTRGDVVTAVAGPVALGSVLTADQARRSFDLFATKIMPEFIKGPAAAGC